MKPRKVISVLGRLVTLVAAGCAPTGGNGGGGGGATPVATVTTINIQRDGFLAIGDGIIAYGNTPGGTTGVSFVKIGNPIPTKIVGSFLGDAIYCAGQKVVLISAAGAKSVNLFDTQINRTTVVPGTDVFDIDPGSYMENADIAVDGNLVAIRNRTATDGKQLWLIDVSGASPIVTAFTAPLNNPINLDLDATAGQIAVMENNQDVAIFPVTGPATAVPTRYFGNSGVGLNIASTPNIRIRGGQVIFKESTLGNVYLLNLSTVGITLLPLNPSANGGTDQLALNGGLFAYYLDRAGQADSFAAQGNRIVVGMTSDPSQVTIGSGTNLGLGTLAGFGYSAAIPPNGLATYIAGRLGQSSTGIVNQPSALQGNFGQGFVLIPDLSGVRVMAADVSATNDIVAFKVDEGGGTTLLGYYLP